MRVQTDLIGTQIKQYRLEARLGDGGMGSVFRALDVRLNRPVALKIMHEHLGRQASFRERFLQEAQALARLQHSSIATVYDMGDAGGVLYIAMEFIRGQTLGAYVRNLEKENRVIALPEALHVTAQVADALDYAHRKGVIHRDIKPDNVMVTAVDEAEREGELPIRAVVTDFGLAKMVGGDVQTQTGSFMGTMPYMSPEQCLGHDLDGRSDIYSLGVMLYQLVTGRLPFRVTSPVDALEKHVRMPPPPVRGVRPDLPETVAAIIDRCLQKEPAQRFPTARAMASALRDASDALSGAGPTQVDGGVSLHTLLTRLDDDVAPPLPSRSGGDLPPLGRGDELLIARKGHAPRRVALDKNLLRIGRSSGNDLVLEDATVSGRHAQLRRGPDGWQLLDLGSTNGTFVSGAKLLPNIPEPLAAGQEVRLGAYYLRLASGGAGAGIGTQVERLPATRAHRGGSTHLAGTVAAGSTMIQTQLGSLILEPAAVEVEAGGAADVTVRVINEWRRVAKLNMEVSGVPASWVTIPQADTSLMPGAEAVLNVRFHPPRESSAAARTHAYRLALTDEDGDRVAAVGGSLLIKPFHAFKMDLHPQQLARPGKSRLAIENEGNSDSEFIVRARTDAETLRFDKPEQRVRVPAGEQSTVTLDISTTRRPLVGGAERLPFTIDVLPAAGTPQAMTGQLVQKARVPIWLLTLAGALLLFSCIASGFALNFFQDRQAGAVATQTAALAATRSAAEAAALQAQVRQTAQAGEAATATALAIAANDDDHDGLSNEQEAALGLDPNDPDTDDDGLQDGEEVNLHGTDPKKQDSDADGLIDGAELEAGAFPNNPDSDNDGILDGADSAPLATSTPTPDAVGTAAVEEATAQAGAQATEEAQAAAQQTAQAQAAATATAQAQAAATAAAMTATAQAQATAQAAMEAEFEKFVDTWVNVDGATRGMTKLIIERVDDETVTFQGFGSCSPSDCDWGVIPAPFGPPTLQAVYDFGYKTTTITVTSDGDQLEAQVFDDYTETDGRADRVTDYTLERLEEREEALAALVGDWRNVDANTSGMTRLIVTRINERTLGLHGFGACSPNDCDWGTTQASYSATGSTGVWTFSFKSTTITIMLTGNDLQVRTLDEYNDTRADRISQYVFRK